MTDSNYQPNEQRVIDRKIALDSEIKDLSDFIRSAHGYQPVHVPARELNLLKEQLNHMMSFARVLAVRIHNFSKPDDTMIVYFSQAEPNDSDPLGERLQKVAIRLDQYNPAGVIKGEAGIDLGPFAVLRKDLRATHPDAVLI